MSVTYPRGFLQGSPRAVVVNSGHENAAIGDRGISDATTVCGVIPAAYFEPAPAADARRQMKDAVISITLTIGAGPGRARMFGCDLSYDYGRINGEYTT